MSIVFATTFFFFFFIFFYLGGGGGGGGVLRHSAVQTDFEFEISGPLITSTLRRMKRIPFTKTYPVREHCKATN